MDGEGQGEPAQEIAQIVRDDPHLSNRKSGNEWLAATFHTDSRKGKILTVLDLLALAEASKRSPDSPKGPAALQGADGSVK